MNENELLTILLAVSNKLDMKAVNIILKKEGFERSDILDFLMATSRFIIDEAKKLYDVE